jgi:hydrogenase maturation protein HypF
VIAVQHHRAHIASVLAERGALDTRVLGVAFDGTGYGDDGAIWGGELFAGSVSEGFARVGHLREAALPGGDAAAQFPVQAAAGFLADLDTPLDIEAPPFSLPSRYRDARRLVAANIRTFRTTSVGRLFDAVAALVGFTRPVTFEGQAAIWLEHLARRTASSSARDALPFPFVDGEFDYRETLAAVIHARRNGVAPGDIARAFHRGLASGLASAVDRLSSRFATNVVVLSGGVFQNTLLLSELKPLCAALGVTVWINREVPANDGGISLGQAAVAAAGGMSR